MKGLLIACRIYQRCSVMDNDLVITPNIDRLVITPNIDKRWLRTH